MVDERGVAETLFPPASTPAGTQYYLMLLLGFLFVSPMLAPSSARLPPHTHTSCPHPSSSPCS